MVAVIPTQGYRTDLKIETLVALQFAVEHEDKETESEENTGCNSEWCGVEIRKDLFEILIEELNGGGLFAEEISLEAKRGGDDQFAYKLKHDNLL